MNSEKQNFITDEIESLKSIIFGQEITDPQQKETKIKEPCKTYEMQINYMHELVEFLVHGRKVWVTVQGRNSAIQGVQA